MCKYYVIDRPLILVDVRSAGTSCTKLEGEIHWISLSVPILQAVASTATFLGGELIRGGDSNFGGNWSPAQRPQGAISRQETARSTWLLNGRQVRHPKDDVNRREAGFLPPERRRATSCGIHARR